MGALYERIWTNSLLELFLFEIIVIVICDNILHEWVPIGADWDKPNMDS